MNIVDYEARKLEVASLGFEFDLAKFARLSNLAHQSMLIFFA
jgi:hypothetical protein